jgi:hypothetical protein
MAAQAEHIFLAFVHNVTGLGRVHAALVNAEPAAESYCGVVAWLTNCAGDPSTLPSGIGCDLPIFNCPSAVA